MSIIPIGVAAGAGVVGGDVVGGGFGLLEVGFSSGLACDLLGSSTVTLQFLQDTEEK